MASDTYVIWAKAAPLQRLGILPPIGSDLEKGRWARVNARAASMLMAALDQSVSVEMVARRLTQSCPGLVFRLLTLYQPGGEQEKALVLQHLQAPSAATTPATAVDSLRAWGRWMRRSESINLTKPDPMILSRGLSSIVSRVLSTDYQASFRTALVRNTLGVDVSPTYEAVEGYHKHLLAEMEAMASGSTTQSTSASPVVAPTTATRMKELRTQVRGAEGHGRTSVPNATVPLRADPKDEEDKAAKRATSAPASPTAPTSARAVRVDESKNQVIDPPGGSQPSTVTALPTSSSTTADLKEVLCEAGKMLKALSASQLKALKVDKFDTINDKV